MKPIESTTPHSPAPEPNQNPVSGQPSDRDQQQFSDMMRQKQREAAPRGQSQESPMELYRRREERGGADSGDQWDPDMPFDNPTDSQMKMMQKQQREKQERVARRREDEQRQPSSEEQAQQDTSGEEALPSFRNFSNAADGQSRPLVSGEQPQKGQGDTPETGEGGDNGEGNTDLQSGLFGQGQGEPKTTWTQPQTGTTGFGEATQQPFAGQSGASGDQPTGPLPSSTGTAPQTGDQSQATGGPTPRTTEQGTPNPAVIGQPPQPTDPGTLPNPVVAEGSNNQQQLLWMTLNQDKKAPTLGKPLPEGSKPESGEGGTSQTVDGTRLSGEHILSSLQRGQSGGEGGGKGGGGKGGGQEGEPGSATPQNAGDAILGMLQQSQQTTDVDGVQATKATHMISDIADKIVDRILVSDVGSTGKDEVRLMLKNSVLPETEVRITREGGNLEIQLVTKDTDAYRLLNERTDGLQNFLKEKLKNDDINVRLQFEDTHTEGGDSEGRSRQQRDLYDEMQEEQQD